jgi:hypothetical protein
LSTARCGQVAAGKDEQLAPGAVAFDAEAVSGQRLPAREIAQLEREAFERRKARRLAVEVTEVEPPTGAVPARVLAYDAIKPALEAGQPVSSGCPSLRRVSSIEDKSAPVFGVRPARRCA